MRESDTGSREELPCIWVLAGVLSYRPCDRDYDCESCELFSVLSGKSGAAPAQRRAEAQAAVGVAAAEPATVPARDAGFVNGLVNPYVWRLLQGCQLHLDRPYSPGHCWLREEGGGEVAVGLDGHVMRMLHPVDEIVAPRVGVWLKRGEPCGWIMRGHSAIPLDAPLSGEVLAVNDRYRSSVRRGKSTGDGDQWLFRLAAHEAVDEVTELLRGERTLVWFLEKIRLLKRKLREAVAPGAPEALGVTMSDGGAPPYLETVLGHDRFEALVEELFHMQI